jgi:hypothetical protein
VEVDQPRRDAIQEIARGILSGDLSADAGAAEIHEIAKAQAIELGVPIPEEWVEWWQLSDELDVARLEGLPPSTRAEIEDRVRESARELLRD